VKFQITHFATALRKSSAFEKLDLLLRISVPDSFLGYLTTTFQMEKINSRDLVGLITVNVEF